MALPNIPNSDLPTFAEMVRQVLTISSPIRTPEKLFGREREMQKIELALYTPGRHVFICGDRGVGKTSLAQTAAFMTQSSERPPLCISCDPDFTLESMIEAIITLAKINTPLHQYKNSTILGLNLPLFKIETRFDELETKNISEPQIKNLASAVSALKYLGENYSQKTIVVIDEFDLIKDENEKKRFGILLKHLSDGDIKVNIIFTGIGQSVNEIIGGHLSSERQIEQVVLDRLHFTGRKSIVDGAFSYFGVDISESVSNRICSLSDGFPYYIHLMCQKILHVCWQDDHVITEVDSSIFMKGLDEAVISAEASLRRSYDAATSRDEHMHYILWAMAEGADLQREKTHIIASYIQVMEMLDIESLSQKEFNAKFSKLRSTSHGNIITHALTGESGIRRGWYRFRENMIRGLVRMQAEHCGIKLNFDRHYSAYTARTSTATVKGIYNPLTPIERQVARLRDDTFKNEE